MFQQLRVSTTAITMIYQNDDDNELVCSRRFVYIITAIKPLPMREGFENTPEEPPFALWKLKLENPLTPGQPEVPRQVAERLAE